MNEQCDCKNCKFARERAAEAMRYAGLKSTSPDPRDTELAALRAQVVEAEKTMGAMADDLEHTVGYAPEYFREKWDLGESLKAFAEYNKKYPGGGK